jgi:hypothetical protein
LIPRFIKYELSRPLFFCIASGRRFGLGSWIRVNQLIIREHHLAESEPETPRLPLQFPENIYLDRVLKGGWKSQPYHPLGLGDRIIWRIFKF